jgi:hypothetical protein
MLFLLIIVFHFPCFSLLLLTFLSSPHLRIHSLFILFFFFFFFLHVLFLLPSSSLPINFVSFSTPSFHSSYSFLYQLLIVYFLLLSLIFIILFFHRLLPSLFFFSSSS